MHIITERALIFATVEIRLIPHLVGVFDGLSTPSDTSMCFCVHYPCCYFYVCQKIHFNTVTKSLLYVMLGIKLHWKLSQ